MPANLGILTRREGEVGFVTLLGEARLEIVDNLRQSALGLLEAGARHLVFEVADLTFADSASLGVILEVQRDTQVRGGILVLAGPPERLRRQLERMGLGDRLAVVADAAAARVLLK